MSKHQEKLFLLDAFALIYRAYFAFSRNPLINSKGMNVSAISGFTSTLTELMSKEKPSHLAVVFDSPEETERSVIFADYKANRQEMPEDIANAIPYIKSIIKAFHIPILEYAGYEADDIIGTIAHKKAAEGHTVFMVTPDKDYAQLVTDRIFIYKPGRAGNDTEILGVEEICRNWEVNHPLQVIDILGLWGDAVDNIPGVPGVGEKTAKKLIKEYGSMEKLFDSASSISGKLGENLRNFQEQGLLSKKLATIELNVPIEVSDEDLALSEPDKEALRNIFTELEFRSLGKKILGDDYTANRTTGQTSLFPEGENAISEQAEIEKGKNIQNTPHEYTLVDSIEKIQELNRLLMGKQEFCFDTETSSLDFFSMNLVGISFSSEKARAWYVPIPEDESGALEILQILRPALENNSILKIGQNIKFDLKILRRYGIKVSPPFFDTMLGHYVCEPDMKHGMDYLSETYLGYTPVSIESLIGKKGKKQGSMRDVPVEEVKEYAAEDADITLQLKEVIKPMAEKREVIHILDRIEHPLIPVLAEMEMTGVRIDSEFLKSYSREIDSELILLREEIYTLAGEQFNLDSPRQLGEILFGKLQIPYTESKTKTGQYSTNEEVLQKLGHQYPITGKILDYRELAKLKSTYVEALPQMIHPSTGRVHTTFNQTIAATGRLSSISPNLQNIPIKTERGQKVRKAFIAADDEHLIVSADYSQIELRLMAEMSGDEAMLSAFREGMDIHQATAARVYGIAPEQVSREMRSKAKMVNFGIIYSISAFGLSQRLGIARSEAKELIDQYFLQFPGIRNYMNETLEFARSHGYVKTMMGRRRYLKDINSRNFTVRGIAEREAINAPVQGSAADLIKMAMINIHRRMAELGLKSKMTLQVHDELVFDMLQSEESVLLPLIREEMTGAMTTRVPLVVEIGKGPDWLSAH
jgi:DNA polymerase-1